jgi:hypothetical protein
MPWSFSSSSNKPKQQTVEEILASQEMCDVCGHSFYIGDMRRIPYVNAKGTLFVIRCCPNCNIQSLTRYL